MKLLIILELISSLYFIGNVEHKHKVKLVINTEYNLIYVSSPFRDLKYYEDTDIKITKDSIVVDSIIFKDLKLIAVNNKLIE